MQKGARKNRRKHMFRMWAKMFKNNRMLKDMEVQNPDLQCNRTRKVFQAIEEICYAFDLAQPVWLPNTIAEFQRHDKCRFTKDNFMEEIDFDYLEIQVIEEDY